MLVEGLPEQARTRRAADDRVWWGFTEELLAQLVELTSIVAADKRITEPRQVPRPGSATTPQASSAATAPPPPANTGYRTMLAAAQRRGAVHA